jgi:hypothetical protein
VQFFRFKLSGNSKIPNFDFSFKTKKYVVRLDISMQDILAVKIFDSLKYLNEYIHDFIFFEIFLEKVSLIDFDLERSVARILHYNDNKLFFYE